MTSSAELLAGCAAAPDDDDPRLVWADFVGGERGELVVVQCALARGDQPPQVAATLRRRERELLALYGETWGAALVPFARRWRYRRGFIEAVELHAGILEDVATQWSYRAALVEHPLLESIALPRLSDADLACVITTGAALRALDLGSWHDLGTDGARDVAARFDRGDLARLRALGVGDLGPTTRAWIAELPLERLRLRMPEQPTHHWLAHVLDRAPHLAGLELGTPSGERVPLEPIVERPLIALRLGTIAHGDWVTIVRGSIARTLEHLAGEVTSVPMLERLALPRLRTLALHGADLEPIAQAIARSDLPHLRVVRLTGSTLSLETVRGLVERLGHQLELLELPNGSFDDVRIDGELRAEQQPRTTNDELFGATAAAMLSVDPPRIEHSKPAVLVRIDRPETWQLPESDCDRRLHLGRGRGSDVQLAMSSIARRHARIEWRGGRHILSDLSSTNGTTVNGISVERSVPLADGDEIVVGGETLLRYFIGDLASERATAETIATTVRDPVTQLPYDRKSRIRLRIPGAPHSIRFATVAVLRALAEQLVAEAGSARLTYVDVGCFGIDDLDQAARLALAPRTVQIFGLPNPLQLELERDP